MTKAKLKLTPYENALRYVSTDRQMRVGVDDRGHFLLRTYDRRAETMKERVIAPSGELGEPEALADYHSEFDRSTWYATTFGGVLNVSEEKITYLNPANSGAEPQVFSVPKGYPRILPDLGVVIVTKTNVVVYNGTDGSVRHALAADTGISSIASSVAASADGRRVFTSNSKVRRIYDFEAEGATVELKKARGNSRFNPTGTVLVRYEGSTATVRTRATEWKEPVTVKAPSGAIVHAAASPDGTKLVLGTKAQMRHLFELKDGVWTLQATLFAPKIDAVYLFAADGALVAPRQEGESDLFHY